MIFKSDFNSGVLNYGYEVTTLDWVTLFFQKTLKLNFKNYASDSQKQLLEGDNG